MADYIKSIMTADGPKPIDYKSLANLPSLNEQQSDWNQSNATAPGFIKNKTHYLVYEDNGSIVENATIISGWDSNFNPTSITISNMPVNNEPVNIYIDGVKYENIQCVSTISGNQQMTHYYGEFDQDLNPKYDNLPFVFGIMTGNNMSAIAVLAFSDGNTDEHTVSVHSINETVHKLDEKYLPKHSHSWNDLEDKPFYSDGKVILETDGNFDDAERIEIVGGINFVRVADYVPKEELYGAKAVADTIEDGLVAIYEEIPESAIHGFNDGFYRAIEFVYGFPTDGYVLTEDVLGVNTTVEKAGLYLIEMMFVESGATYLKISKETTKTLDEKYIPDTLARIKDVLSKSNTEEYTPTEDYHPVTKKYVDTVKEDILKELDEIGEVKYRNIIMIDAITGEEYIVQMQNGSLVSFRRGDGVAGLAISAMPTRVDYIEGEKFDPTGMVISAVYQDGTNRILESNEYTYDEYISMNATSVEVYYTEMGETVSVDVPLDIKSMEEALIDFEYTYDEDTGMYTLTDWKGTYRGKSSTELIIPDNAYIML